MVCVAITCRFFVGHPGDVHDDAAGTIDRAASSAVFCLRVAGEEAGPSEASCRVIWTLHTFMLLLVCYCKGQIQTNKANANNKSNLLL